MTIRKCLSVSWKMTQPCGERYKWRPHVKDVRAGARATSGGTPLRKLLQLTSLGEWGGALRGGALLGADRKASYQGGFPSSWSAPSGSLAPISLVLFETEAKTGGLALKVRAY